MKNVIVKTLLLISVVSLVACGGSDKKKSNSSSSAPASSVPASSSAVSSSVAPVSNVMEVGKEYPYTNNTKITNTGKTELAVEKKYYWESQKTVVILKEGNATID